MGAIVFTIVGILMSRFCALAAAGEKDAAVLSHIADVDGMISWRSSPFSADGTRFVTDGTCESGRALLVWDTKTCKQVARPMPQDHLVSFYQLSSDGSRLFAGQATGHMAIWNARASTPILTRDLGHEVDYAKFSPDGMRYVALADDVANLELWRANDMAPFAVLKHSNAVELAAFDRSGARIVTRESTVGSWLKCVHLWDAKTGLEACPPIQSDYDGDTYLAETAAFDASGKRLAIAQRLGFTIIDPTNGKVISDGKMPAGDLTTDKIRFSADGSAVALVTICYKTPGAVHIFESATGKFLRSLAPGTYNCEISGEGRWLFAARPDDESTEVWDIVSGSKVQTLRKICGPMWLSPEGTTLAIAGAAETSVWRVANGGSPITRPTR